MREIVPRQNEQGPPGVLGLFRQCLLGQLLGCRGVSRRQALFSGGQQLSFFGPRKMKDLGIGSAGELNL